jgi:plasmid stabilization system protein ParE
VAPLELFWSETALKQRRNTFEYWNDRNGSNLYSQRLSKLIKKRSKRLLSFPLIGRKVEIENVHAISIEHFSLFYEVVENKVVILSFWDNRRDPRELLKQLRRDYK